MPLLGGVLAVAVATLAEIEIRRGGADPSGIALYAFASVIFALSAIPLPRARADCPEPACTAAAPRRASLAASVVPLLGCASALGLAYASYCALRIDIQAPVGLGCWVGALGVLMIAAASASRENGWPARWGAQVMPGARSARIGLGWALAALILLTVIARVLWLDRLPLGINPDEGDRAGRMALNIVRGINTQGAFDSGWYYISMVYFTLLAGFMKIVGVGYVEARLFHAICGIATVALVVVIGIRNFGWRVGLLAGAVFSTMGVALQFSRVTTEAAVTALLWTASAACLFEAARGGRLWAWSAAGILGGFSIYFYPTGRVWPLLAIPWSVYLLARQPHRRRIALGVAAAAVGAMITVAPYLANIATKAHELTLRFDQTSVFNVENAMRLGYFNPEWSIGRLLLEQLRRCIFTFDAFPDGGGFWPHLQPIAQPVLAVPILLGLGWSVLRWRNPRIVLLALWFWAGTLGMVVTVETPNIQRMATAIPVLPLLVALVIDSVARRIEFAGRMPAGFANGWGPARALARVIAATVAVAFAVVIMVAEARFYFVDYARMDLWRPWNALADAARNEGSSTFVATLGRSFHMITSGWVQLIALETPKGGIPAPGASLPLALDPGPRLTFAVFPDQEEYLPYLRDVYPDGVLNRIADASGERPDQRTLFTLFRISADALRTSRGAMVTTRGGVQQRAERLGAAPPGWVDLPAAMTWTAGLRVDRYWNYAFRIGPGPAKLEIDGRVVAAVGNGEDEITAVVALARGDHFIRFDGVVPQSDKLARIEWARMEKESATPTTAPVPIRLLDATMTSPRGLLGAVTVGDSLTVHQWRLDNALATCCLRHQLQVDDRPYAIRWQGFLVAPRGGLYEITLVTEGRTTIRIGGELVVDAPGGGDPRQARGSVFLTAGPHPIEVLNRSTRGPGVVELAWTPPEGVRSIIPPTALRPPPGAGIGPAVAIGQLGVQVPDAPIEPPR